jgi:ribose transport system permease protein
VRAGIDMDGLKAKSLLANKDVGITASAVALFVFFSLASGSFLTQYNLFNVSRTVGFFVLVALSQAVALVVGGMNLSVGAIGGLATITAGYLIAETPLPGTVGAIAALGVGAAAGAFNGLIITRLRINSFITTLATLFIFTGLVFGISKGFAYTEIPRRFTLAGRGEFLLLSNLFWIALVTLAVVHFMFRHTVFGRHLLATGSNAEAARLSGVETDQMVLAANVLSGVFAAMAAVLWVSRMGSAQPATGKDWLINSFAVAIVGGTALSGGSISAVGILMGAIIIVLIKNGLVMLNANVYYEQAFLGAIILAAVILDRARALWSRQAS